MQTSGREQKAPLRPHEGGEPASLTPRGPLTRRWLEVLGWRADLLPFPAPPLPLPRPGSPLGSPGARGADCKGGGRGRGLQGAPPGGEAPSSCRLCGLISGCQAWWQVPLLPESFHHPVCFKLYVFLDRFPCARQPEA